MPNAKIAGTGSYLPEKILTNADLEKMVETSDEWIVKRVGIKERHLVADSGDTTCSMGTKAAERAIEAAGITANDIDLIIVGTASPDNFFPSAACVIQKNLGIKNGCAAFDVNAACPGFVYAMTVADKFIRTGESKNALIIGVDTLSTVVDWNDRTTCVLFGDGAGAAVLQASEEPGIITTNIRADGEYADLLYAKSSLWDKENGGVLSMDGRAVFKIAVKKLDEIVDETLAKAGMEKADIDWLIPHQANLRIIQATAKRLDLPMERVILTVQKHGNTSAASIPLALDEAARNNTIKRGDTLMLEAFGAGLTWGATLVRY